MQNSTTSEQVIASTLALPPDHRMEVLDAIQFSLLGEPTDEELAARLKDIDRAMENVATGRTRPMKDVLREIAARCELKLNG